MKIFNAIIDSTYIRKASVLASGTILAQLITSLSYVVITRIYIPDELGEFSFFQSTAIILSIIGTATFEQVIILPKEDTEGRNILKLCLITLSGFTIILLITSVIFGPYFSRLTIYSHLFFILIPVGAFLIGAINCLSYWVIRLEHVKILSISKIIQASSSSILQISFGLISKFQFSMIYGFLVGRAFTLYFLYKRTLNSIQLITKKQFFDLIKRYSKQPKFYLPSRLLSQAATESPILLIGILFDNILLGFYSLAYRVITVPSSYIGVAVGLIFFKEINDLAINQKPITPIIIKTWLTLIAIGLIPLTLIYLYGEELFIVVFGDTWGFAGTIASIYSPVILLKFASAPTEKTLIILNKQQIVTLFSLLDFLLRSSSIIIGFLYFDFITSIYFIAFFHLMFTILLNGYLIILSNSHDIKSLQNE